HRERLPVAGDRPHAGDRHFDPGYPAGAGRRPGGGGLLRPHQSAGGRAPGGARSARQGLMTAVTVLDESGDAPVGGRPGAWARLGRNRLAVIGLALVAALTGIAAAAPLLPLADPNATDVANRLQEPFSATHWLGTDQLGRDILARLVWGTRVSLAVGIAATLVATIIGAFIGLVAAYYGRWLDNLLMRGIDMLMAFPYLLLALAIVAVLGPGLLNAMFAIAVVNIPFFARAVRGATVGLVTREYVDAARLCGFSDSRII